MNELLTINYETENPTVSARELHEALEVKSKYADWFKNMCQYGFTENVDYSTVSKNLENGGRTIEHDLSIDMAKEICMLQRTEKGKQCRTYFIELEKAWNTPEQIFARALKMADRKIMQLQTDNAQLLLNAKLDRPKVVFADAVATSPTTILVRELAKMLHQNRVDIGEKRLFEWLRNNGYLIKKGTDRNMPTQRAMELGLFEIKETVISHSSGYTTISKTVKVTGKGQQYFINKFLSNH